MASEKYGLLILLVLIGAFLIILIGNDTGTFLPGISFSETDILIAIGILIVLWLFITHDVQATMGGSVVMSKEKKIITKEDKETTEITPGENGKPAVEKKVTQKVRETRREPMPDD
ncbi:MAG: hypothetical protein J4215_06175 [Candidatus Diapherotrites archaeon]|uniref:Uncharacterized protein n=1 Tax=Candidatus Iainarchaeum sp. TaxID=3101447 RepID=A0A8T4L489_9ARCH|nr:hypothetical protein [Candidatus Diapherotrites archaeon]